MRTSFGLDISSEEIEVITPTGLVIKKPELGDWTPLQLGKSSVKADLNSKAYLFGLFMGDGCRQHGGKYGTSDILVANHELHLLDLVSKSPFLTKVGVVDSTTVFNVNKELHNYFKENLSSMEDKSNYKIGKDWISKMSKTEKASVLRGWFDADGSSSDGNVKISAKSSMKPQLENIGRVLQDFGIVFRLSPEIKVNVFGGEFYRYDLCLVGTESYDAFRKQIGFTEPKKHSQIRRNKERGCDGMIPPCLGLWVGSLIDKSTIRKTLMYDRCRKFLYGQTGMSVIVFKDVFKEYKNLTPVSLVFNGVRFRKIIN